MIHKVNQPKIIKHIPIQLPSKRIYARLGYNPHFNEINEEQKIKIEKLINSAFLYCEPVGVWFRMKIIEILDNKIILDNNNTIESKSLAKLLNKSNSILLLGATTGKNIVDAVERFITKKDTASALIYDAVGSETTDSILDWMQEYLGQIFLRKRENLTKRRFSPGYGDLELKNQKIIYDILGFKQIGIDITEKYMLIPEKSVIAISGIENQ